MRFLQRIAYGFLIILLIIAFAFLFRMEVRASCSAKLENGLTKDYTFKSDYIRSVARMLYDYRAKYKFNPVSNDNYVSLFLAANKVKSPPSSDQLKDITLYKLTSEPESKFSVLVSYYQMFNHDKYVKCLQAYDGSKFKQIAGEKQTTRDIIINDVLNLGTATIASLTDSAHIYLKSTDNSFDSSQQAVFDKNLGSYLTANKISDINTDDPTITALLQFAKEKIASTDSSFDISAATTRDILNKLGVSGVNEARGKLSNADSSVLDKVVSYIKDNSITSILHDLTDPELYSLLKSGFIGAT